MYKKTIIIFIIFLILAAIISTIGHDYFPEKYVGNPNTHIYHTMDCYYSKQISSPFYFKEIPQGYRACKICIGGKHGS